VKKKTAPPGKGRNAQGKRPPWMPDLPVTSGAKGATRAGTPRPARGHQPAARGPQPPRKKGHGHLDPHAQREAERYEHPIPSREAIIKFLSDHGQLLTAEALAAELGMAQPRDFEALTKRLSAMVRDGQLLQNRRSGYGVAQKLDLIPGAIIANAEGFGFLRPDAGGDDLYLSPTEMRKVLHGDRVLASVVASTGVDASKARSPKYSNAARRGWSGALSPTTASSSSCPTTGACIRTC